MCGLAISAWVAIIISQAIGQTIVGYDCGVPHSNITTISLLSVGQCTLPDTEPNVTQIHIQLLQISKFERIEIVACKISIFRNILYCGMHSHTSAVLNGQADFVTGVSYEQCKEMHQTGTLTLSVNNVVRELKVNQTTTRPVIFAGTLTTDGSCTGAQYSDPYGTWNNVVVQGIITVTLQQYTTPADLETDKIHLKSGTTCRYTNGGCIDFEGGYAFWKVLPTDNCKFNQYSILYEGLANKMMDIISGQSQVVYSLTTHDITFALAQKGVEPLCGYTLIKTEHPKLLILEALKGEGFATRKKLDVENLDIFTYMNSKFIYVEKHIRTQISRLYRDVLKQRCTLEQQVLQNGLALAADSPDEFAYYLMEEPGYMAVIAGEVVHIIKCIPVNVQIDNKEQCYQELPVLKGNDSYYLSPKTHILMKTGTQVSCDKIVSVMFYLSDRWYKITPNIENALTPVTMEPMTKPTWQYLKPAPLGTTGIYSQKDVDTLRDHIMFPAEKPAILNTMARGISGQTMIDQGLSFSNLLDENTLEKFVKSTTEKMWSGFISFGTASSGIIGLYICGRLIKLLIDTVIHGYALHTLYGWSIYLIGALWDSVTNLLLHLGRGPKKIKSNQTQQNLSLQPYPGNDDRPSAPINDAAIETGETSGTPKPVETQPNAIYPKLPSNDQTAVYIPL